MTRASPKNREDTSPTHEGHPAVEVEHDYCEEDEEDSKRSPSIMVNEGSMVVGMEVSIHIVVTPDGQKKVEKKPASGGRSHRSKVRSRHVEELMGSGRQPVLIRPQRLRSGA